MLAMVAARYLATSRKVSNWFYVMTFRKWEILSMDMAGKVESVDRFFTKHEAEADCRTFNDIMEEWPPEQFEHKKTYSIRRMTRNQILRERDNERADKGTPELSG